LIETEIDANVEVAMAGRSTAMGIDAGLGPEHALSETVSNYRQPSNRPHHSRSASARYKIRFENSITRTLLQLSQNAAALLFDLGTVDIRRVGDSI
jgi:hypothetical protein